MGLPPDKYFQHTIKLKPRIKPIIVTPYRHPRHFKDEIKCTIEYFLGLGHIHHSTNPFTSPIILVKKKDDTLIMSIDYQALNKNTNKNQYTFQCIDDLIDELHREVDILFQN